MNEGTRSLVVALAVKSRDEFAEAFDEMLQDLCMVTMITGGYDSVENGDADIKIQDRARRIRCLFHRTGGGTSHCLLRIGTIACHQRPTAPTAVFDLAARSPWQAHGGNVSFIVTEPFPFLRPWHCVESRSCLPVVAVGNHPPMHDAVHAHLYAARWKKPQLLCGEPPMHHVCECATRSESWRVDKAAPIGP